MPSCSVDAVQWILHSIIAKMSASGRRSLSNQAHHAVRITAAFDIVRFALGRYERQFAKDTYMVFEKASRRSCRFLG